MAEIYIRKNFTKNELECPCVNCRGKGVLPTDDCLDMLQSAREFYGAPMHVSSGVRCDWHNNVVGGAKNSRHLPAHRDGADIRCTSPNQRFAMVHALMLAGASCIKVYAGHIHADVRPGMKLFLLD